MTAETSVQTSDRSRLLALASVTAGAIGNLIDRVRSHQGVVDFLDFGFGEVRWPVFNVADMCINAAAALILVQAFRGIRLDGTRVERRGDPEEPEDS